MAQEPTDRRRRPSAHMVKAERYFFSNWPLQLLPSRPWREPRRTNRDRTRATCTPLRTHTRHVCGQHRPMGVNLFHNGQLCAWPFTNKNSLPPSSIWGQQTVNRAETVHSTSARGVQSCAQVNIDLHVCIKALARRFTNGQPARHSRSCAIVTPETCAASWSLPALRRSTRAP